MYIISSIIQGCFFFIIFSSFSQNYDEFSLTGAYEGTIDIVFKFEGPSIVPNYAPVNID